MLDQDDEGGEQVNEQQGTTQEEVPSMTAVPITPPLTPDHRDENDPSILGEEPIVEDVPEENDSTSLTPVTPPPVDPESHLPIITIDKDTPPPSEALATDGIKPSISSNSKQETITDDLASFVVVVDDYKEDFDAKIKLNCHHNGAGFPSFPFSKAEQQELPFIDGKVTDEMDAEEQMRRRMLKLNQPNDIHSDDREDLVERPTFQFLRKPNRQPFLDSHFDTSFQPVHDAEPEDDLEENDGDSLDNSVDGLDKHRDAIVGIIVIAVLALSVLTVLSYMKYKKRRARSSYLPIHTRA